VEPLRGRFIRYDLHGFLLSAAATSDIWDVELRYQKEANAFHFASGIGDMRDSERQFSDLRGPISLIHDATGRYLSIAGGVRNAKHSLGGPEHPAYFHYAQLGGSKQRLSFGKTTVFADRGFYKNFNVSALLSINPDTNLAVVGATLTGTGVPRWGFAVEQGLDAAATLIYARAHFYDPKIVGPACDFLTATVCCGDSANTSNLPAGAWQGLMIGARMQFLNGRSSRTRWPNANTGDG
jgi:hypothetical protein